MLPPMEMNQQARTTQFGTKIGQADIGGFITALGTFKGSVKRDVFGVIDSKYKNNPKTGDRIKKLYSFGTGDITDVFGSPDVGVPQNQGVASQSFTIDTRSPLQRWFETYGFFTLISVVVIGALVYSLRVVTPSTRTRSTGTRRRSTTTTRTSGRTVKKKVNSATRLPKRPKKGDANYKEKMSKYMRALRNRKK